VHPNTPPRRGSRALSAAPRSNWLKKLLQRLRRRLLVAQTGGQASHSTVMLAFGSSVSPGRWPQVRNGGTTFRACFSGSSRLTTVGVADMEQRPNLPSMVSPRRAPDDDQRASRSSLDHFSCSLRECRSTRSAFPWKPLRIIVASRLGGAATLTSRLPGNRWLRCWGQPVIAENRRVLGG